MPRNVEPRPSASIPVEVTRHTGDQRVNITTAELESFAAADAATPRTRLYPSDLSLDLRADEAGGAARTSWPPRRRKLPLSEAAKRWLPTVKRRIVERFEPERIVLFGSQVAGTARWDSDIDLLVVLSAITDPRSARLEIRRALRDIPVAKDIFVTTPDRAARFGAIPGTVLHPALQEGATIYVRR